MTTHITSETNTESRLAVYALALAAFTLAMCLLGLQIVGGLEYTAGGSLYTRASMIAGMATIAVLPVFVEAAFRYRLGGIGVGLCIAFCAFLAYSLPATTGRTGEIKEVKAAAATDIKEWKAELKTVETSLVEALPAKISECAGAPDPLPAKGWPLCRQSMGVVATLQARKAELEGKVSAASNDKMGDLGSDLWAWALSWLGLTAATIRKASVLCFAIGLDFVIWSLVAFGSIMLQRGARVGNRDRLPTVSDSAQTSFPPATEPPPAPPQPPRGKRTRKSNRLPANVIDFRKSKYPAVAAIDKPARSVSNRRKDRRDDEAHPVITAIKKARRSVSNRELSHLMQCSEGEASKRVQEIEHQLVIGRKGKELRIGLRKSA